MRIFTNLRRDLLIFLTGVLERDNFVVRFFIDFREAVAVELSSYQGRIYLIQHFVGQIIWVRGAIADRNSPLIKGAKNRGN